MPAARRPLDDARRSEAEERDEEPDADRDGVAEARRQGIDDALADAEQR